MTDKVFQAALGAEKIISLPRQIFDKFYEIGSWIYDIRTSLNQWSRAESYMLTAAWKSQYDLTANIDTTHYTMKFNPPIELKSPDYCIGMLNLETYYSFPNIGPTNNTILFRSPKKGTWLTISLPTGAYNIFDINVYINLKIMENGDETKSVSLKELSSESRCEMTLKKNVMVSFDVRNPINKILGFNEQPYGSSTATSNQIFISENTVDILDINSIYVNCDLIKNSYDNGKISTALYTFFPTVPPNYKIIERPSPPVYIPINSSSISSITIWLTSEDGKPIDFRGETITIRFYLQKLPLK